MNLYLARGSSAATPLVGHYAVTPLGPEGGLVQWAEGHGTLQALIQEHRAAAGVALDLEKVRPLSSTREMAFKPVCVGLAT